MKLPNSVESEKVFLSFLLNDSSLAKDLILDMTDEYFFEEVHKVIFKKIQADVFSLVDYDILSLDSYLQDVKAYKQCGKNYLTDLKSNYYNFNLSTHYDILKEKYYLRKIAELNIQSQIEIVQNNDTVKQKLQEYMGQMFDLSQIINKSRSELEHVGAISDTALLKLDQIINSESKYTGIATGYSLLDEMLSGLNRTDLITIAGRSSSGKSSLFTSIVSNAAIINPKLVICAFSLEMSKEQLVLRLISSISHVPLFKLRTGKLSDYDWARFMAALDFLKECTILLDDTPAVSNTYIHNKLRSVKSKYGTVDLVIVDYLQLMSPTKTTSSRVNDVGDISSGLKVLAKTHNVPVVSLSQLSRAPENRLDHRPKLSDLRDSGTIENDSDVVIFIYREELYNPTFDNKNVGELIVAKQRNGPIGSVHVAFIKELTKFMNVVV